MWICLVSLAVLSARQAEGQALNVAMAQKNGQSTVQSEVAWFQSSARSAPSYGDGGDAGYGLVWRQFEMLQASYNAFKSTLTPQQGAAGANDLAQLDAGLGILEEAFTNYQQAVINGQSSITALHDMCQALYQGSGVWLQDFNSVCWRLQVGWR